jgi:hypothetical protein
MIKSGAPRRACFFYRTRTPAAKTFRYGGGIFRKGRFKSALTRAERPQIILPV